ncbi:MAG: glutamate 5-kinase [Deltaproteobacteria bacterium RBG_13_65_10]|jgi:glutamate 5-kinase|nr:MAG: glutamate 5-kinase [Deltaproteobacteria bacterium RBG_13_65_10]
MTADGSRGAKTAQARAERRRLLAKVQRVVVKVGSAVLTDDGAGLDARAIGRIGRDISEVIARGTQVILVSSGAIAAGRSRLGLSERPRTIPQKQAAAAVGQSALIQAWERTFARHGRRVGQILLTADDLANRKRFLNARHTLMTLLRLGVIPVINENDTVAVDEIKFGDNDHLSALVTNLIQADLLLILTDTEGLHERDPRRIRKARLVPLVHEITPQIERAAEGEGGAVGTGGMASKIAAARKTTHSGVLCIVAGGRRRRCLPRILEGESIGTLFLPREARLTSRKHWIAFTREPRGTLRVDAGAVAALKERGKSLLPSGVTEIVGRFGVGDLVRIMDPQGREFARGLVEYPADELVRIKGRKTSEIERTLGYKSTDEVVHRDDLVLL